jgi:DNA-binding winged helix-turn-helix (wHTH) protein
MRRELRPRRRRVHPAGAGARPRRKKECFGEENGGARPRTSRREHAANVDPRSLVVLDEVFTFRSPKKLFVLSDVSPPGMDEVFAFGDFLLDERELLLRRGGVAVPLSPKPFAVLALLVRRPERLVRRNELLRLAWPDTIVSDATLSQTIWRIRTALSVGGELRDPIQTVARAGYRFVAPVRRLRRDEPSPD